MAFRSALVPLTATSDTKATVGRALAVAKAFDLHLDVVFVRPDPEETLAYTGLEPADFDAATQEMQGIVEKHGRHSAERARRRFHEACDAAGVSHGRTEGPGPGTASWHVLKGEPTFVVPEIACTADLTIFSGALARYNLLFENVLEATLLRAGSPVLLLPEAFEALQPRDALIAWDGGTPCARAVSSWLASGFSAGSATLFNITEVGEEQPKLDGVRDRLARHGVEVRIAFRERHLEPVGQMLLSEAEAKGAGLLVMGGYGKSRYREAVFGGVTRHVIRQAAIPVFLTH